MIGRSYRRDATRSFAEGVHDRMQSMEALQLQLIWLLQSVLQQEHRHHHEQVEHHTDTHVPVSMTAEEVVHSPFADQQHRHLQAQADQHVDAQVPMHHEEHVQVPVLTQEHLHHHEQVEHPTDTHVPQEHEEIVHVEDEDYQDCREPSCIGIGVQTKQRGTWTTKRMQEEYSRQTAEVATAAATESMGKALADQIEEATKAASVWKTRCEHALGDTADVR